MLNEMQMEMVEKFFEYIKEMLFAEGEVPQSLLITKGIEMTMFPIPEAVQVNIGAGTELMDKLGEVTGTELVIFISQIQEPEKLMMLVLETETKEYHMKIGDIKKDCEGGAYIENDEWQEVDLSIQISDSPTLNS